MNKPADREKFLTDKKPLQKYWHIRLERLKNKLEKNNIEAFIAPTASAAKGLIMDDILPRTEAKSIAWGGSMTMEEIGLGAALRQRKDLTQIDPMEKGLSASIAHLRKAISVDLYFSGTNAVTEAGQLVNLDMLGNRVGAITFGPTHVVIIVGRNKIVSDLEAAIDRIRNYVAPAHLQRIGSLMGFDFDTPCVKTGTCQNCNSKMRSCNAWGIIEKSYPAGRIKIVLVNADLGV